MNTSNMSGWIIFVLASLATTALAHADVNVVAGTHCISGSPARSFDEARITFSGNDAKKLYRTLSPKIEFNGSAYAFRGQNYNGVVDVRRGPSIQCMRYSEHNAYFYECSLEVSEAGEARAPQLQQRQVQQQQQPQSSQQFEQSRQDPYQQQQQQPQQPQQLQLQQCATSFYPFY